MGNTPSEKGYSDGKSGKDPDPNYDNSGVGGRMIDIVSTVLTGSDRVGEADKADRDYHGGHAAGKADRESGK